MYFEEALYTHLSSTASSTGLMTLVSSSDPRIYPLNMPQMVTYPAVVFQKISAQREPTMNADCGIVFATLQVDCYSTSYAVAKRLAKEVHTKLKNYTGVMGGTSGVQVDYTEYQQEMDDYIDAIKTYRVIQEFEIAYHE